MDNQNSNEFFYDKFDFKNSAIIQPPEPTNKPPTKMKYILIDSRDRNMLRYPNSNKFTIHLDEVIKDVTEIELMSAYIPSSNYTISKNNDRVYFIKNTTTMAQLYVNNTLVKSEIYYAKLKHGKYAINTTTNLTFEDSKKIYQYDNDNDTTKTLNNNPITFTDNICKYNITLEAGDTTKYNIHFRGEPILDNNTIIDYNILPKSANDILGFNKNYGYTLDNVFDDDIPTIAGVHKSNITPTINDYVLLHLDNFERFEGRISNNNAVKNAYAKLHTGVGGATRNVFFGRIKAFTNALEMNPVLQKLDRFDINFTDYYGNEYDFNNAELSLTFGITYKTQPGYFDF